MAYTMLDELTITFDAETAEEIYAYVAANYPKQEREAFIWDNMDFVKRTFNSSVHSDFLEYLWAAIKNNYAGASGVGGGSEKTTLEILIDLFCIEDRAQKIYDNVKKRYPNLNCDELIKVNIDFAKKKQKTLGSRFIPYLQEAIEKDMAGYNRNVQKPNA